jgi:hypothetical protein
MALPCDQDGEIDWREVAHAVAGQLGLIDVDEEPRPIDQAYVEELARLLGDRIIELTFVARRVVESGDDLVALAGVLHDLILAVELATGLIR